jgi:hypothetical protein
MANVIIDSSTFGKIIKDRQWESLVRSIIQDRNFIVFNFRIIREELRKAPKQVLRIYDQIVSTNMINETKEMTNLANEYYVEYKKNGGGKGKKNIINDFKIVACASIKNCDLLFSEDEGSLKCKNALSAYRLVNLKRNYRTPTFYNLLELKKRYLA